MNSRKNGERALEVDALPFDLRCPKLCPISSLVSEEYRNKHKERGKRKEERGKQTKATPFLFKEYREASNSSIEGIPTKLHEGGQLRRPVDTVVALNKHTLPFLQ